MCVFVRMSVMNITRALLTICLLLGGIVQINIFSIIYTILFLIIPWSLIYSRNIRLRLFFILSIITLINSVCFVLMISGLHIFAMTNKGKDVFRNECSFNVRILQHFGLILWKHTANKILFVLALIINIIILCKKKKRKSFSFEKNLVVLVS